jgi:DNA-binding HxlR family transcriptional regulator
MLPRTYEGQRCSIAKALELLGERWTLLVIREAFLGTRRFEAFAEHLDIARNVLTARLSRLVEEGVLDRVRYQERPERFEYRLTEKGIDLWPVTVALMHWGDRHYPAEGGSPRVIRHRDCGGELTRHLTCARCGAELGPRDVMTESGPGARGERARPPGASAAA